MRVAANDTADVKGVRGYFYLGGAADKTTTQRLLFINYIQFIRFHKEKVPEEVAPVETAPTETVEKVDNPKEKTHEEKSASSIGERNKNAELPAAEVDRR